MCLLRGCRGVPCWEEPLPSFVNGFLCDDRLMNQSMTSKTYHCLQLKWQLGKDLYPSDVCGRCAFEDKISIRDNKQPK